MVLNCIVDYLRKKEWASNSPDLSPIEWVWGRIKYVIMKERPKTMVQLKSLIHKVWDSITTQELDDFYKNQRIRFETCIAQNGSVVRDY